jgi:hypothetical protein
MSGSIVQSIVAVLLVLFAFYKIWMLVKQTRRNTASLTWPVIAAEVLHKEVHSHRSSKGNTSYMPVVTYKYSVIGTEYNNTINLSGLWSRNSAQKALDEIGETLEVRYNPDNPNENTHGYDKVKFTDYLLILLMLGLAAYILIPQLMK